MRLENTAIHKLILLIVFVGVTIQVGCSPESRHRALVFFFDGVEPSADEPPIVDPCVGPELPVSTDEQLTAERSAVQQVGPSAYKSQHPPYMDRACGECHQRMAANATASIGGSLCFNCHDSVAFEFDFVHGPVAVGACTQCHHPHAGRFASLLNEPIQTLCLSCHDAADVSRNENHDMETDCTECHAPHGGSDPFFF